MPRRLLLLSSILLGLPAMAMAQSATNWVPEQNRGAAEADAAGIRAVPARVESRIVLPARP